MVSSAANETEILLGNKQLLAIFFVVALLLGVAFTGGYMIGKNSGEKKPLAAALTDSAAAPAASSGATETHVVQPASTEASPADSSATTAVEQVGAHEPPPDAPLGSPKHKAKPSAEAPTPSASDSYTPKNGQTFLQVTAVGRNEADALADVLSKKGFHAHSVQKPGSTDIYRVLVGPIRDTGELSSTRDALRNNAGFTKVIVQRY